MHQKLWYERFIYIPGLILSELESGNISFQRPISSLSKPEFLFWVWLQDKSWRQETGASDTCRQSDNFTKLFLDILFFCRTTVGLLGFSKTHEILPRLKEQYLRIF